MAYFEKRASGRWRARVRRLGHPDLSNSFRTRALAEQWARQVESEIERGVFVDRTEADRTTLGELLKRYAEEVTPTKKGAASELFRINAMCRDRLASSNMSALSSAKIASWRNERLKVVSTSTVLRDLNLLGHVIETARREWGIALGENPTRHVRKPRALPSRERRLTGDEESRLLAYYACDGSEREGGRLKGAAGRNPMMKAVIILAIETAMRQSEISGLSWKYIDIDRRVATLNFTKNGSVRSVPLTLRAVEVLKGLTPGDDGAVFPGLTSEAVKRSFIRACRTLKLDDLRFHDLRHEATSRLFEKGLNPMEVASCTGHKTLQMLKRYTHFSVDHLIGKIG